MEVKNFSKVSHSFYKVVHSEAKIEELIETIKANKLPKSERYAYQAFCYAMMAKEASSMIQKGKYIQQYGEFINKAMIIENDCYEARLFRFIVEKRLENVGFISHQQMDKEFLSVNMNLMNDDCLKHITQKALENE